MTKAQRKRFEEAEEAFFTQIGIEYPYTPPKTHYQDTDPDKIVVISDPHAPYYSREVLEYAIANCKDAGTLIVSGDVFDGASKSRFRLMEHVDFGEEMRGTFGYLETLHVHFPRVLVMKGNHDNRAEKKIAELMSQGHTDLLSLTERDLLGRLTSYFPGMKQVGVEIQIQGDGKHRLGHIYQHGDIVFLHAEKSQTQESALLKTLDQQVRLWASEFGLKPYRVIAQAHNHAATKMFYGDTLLMQMPCAMESKTKGGMYVFSPRMQYRPSKKGVTVFYQKNGRTDFNRSNWIVL